MADYTPFNAMLDPAKSGTLTGFIGGLMGRPTQEQAQGGATGIAVKAISDLVAQGKTPQEATLAFFQTPQGQDFFANAGPQGMQQLLSGIQSTVNPAPTITNVPAGGTAFQTDQRGNVVGQMASPVPLPPTKVGPQEQLYDRNGKLLAENKNADLGKVPAAIQEFNYFSDIAKLPPDQIRKLALTKIDPSQADKSTAQTQAIDEMVSKYGLNEQTALGLKAGTLQLKPINNEFGQGTGSFGLFDTTKPDAGVTIISPKGTTGGGVLPPAVTENLPGSTPATGSAAGALPAAPPGATSTVPAGSKNFGSKASMFLGAGAVPHLLGTASNVSEQLNSGSIIPEGAQATDRQNLINNLRSSITAMGQMGEGISVNKGTVESYMRLAPTGGALETPYEGVQKAIRLYDKVGQEIAAEQTTMRNASAPQEIRKAAAKRIEGWSRVLRDLPTQEELRNMEQAIREGKAGALDVAGGVKALSTATGKFLTEAKKQAGQVSNELSGPDFSTMNAEQLVAIDPRTLDRNQQIQYRRAIDRVKRTLQPSVPVSR